ncbi:hypothetical protein [Raineyella sp. LH-20]|uniref:hypothetical protein n=1 Tax=Raineyella sp. LH-20 TaxID=3081204 RepID=UPI002954D3C9|nr:hypothetical protein [Raineyella sp. LH-20]WOP18329.1 hypothetical protein R0146_14040 [Raineyella sp. LH-20]
MTTVRPKPVALPDTELFTADDVLHYSGDRLLLERSLRRGDAVRVCRGVFARRRPADEVERHLQLVRAVCARPGHTGAIGGISAALLHGLQTGLARLPATATVLRPSGGGPTADLDVLTTRLPASHVCEIDGLSVSTVARTVVDITRREHPGGLTGLVVADSALRTSPDPAALRRACETVLADLRGCTGLAQTRRVLREATPHAAGPVETMSRVLLQHLGIPAPLLDVTYLWEQTGRSDGWSEADEPDGPLGGLGRWAPQRSAETEPLWMWEAALELFRPADAVPDRPPTAAPGTVSVPFSWPDVGVLGVVVDRPVDEDGVPAGWPGDRASWVDGPRRFLRSLGWVVVEWSAEDLIDPWPLSQRLTKIMRELRGTPAGAAGWIADHSGPRRPWAPTGWGGGAFGPDRW